MMQMIEMNQIEFEAFQRRSVQNLTNQRIEDFFEDVPQALSKAQETFYDYLPTGLHTPNNYFYQLKNDQMICCGYLWFGRKPKNSEVTVFIYDILVEEKYRGLGYSKIMLGWLEVETQKMNISEITLHVLGTNHRARELYDSLGFEMTNIYMSKKI